MTLNLEYKLFFKAKRTDPRILLGDGFNGERYSLPLHTDTYIHADIPLAPYTHTHTDTDIPTPTQDIHADIPLAPHTHRHRYTNTNTGHTCRHTTSTTHTQTQIYQHQHRTYMQTYY